MILEALAPQERSMLCSIPQTPCALTCWSGHTDIPRSHLRGRSCWMQQFLPKELIVLTGTTRLTKPLSSPHNSCKEPGPRGTFTFCSSSKVSWQHSQNPLLFLGTVTCVERGLFPPALCRAQPSAPLQGTAQGHLTLPELPAPQQGPAQCSLCTKAGGFPEPRNQQ